MKLSTRWTMFFAWPSIIVTHTMITGQFIFPSLLGRSLTKNDDSVNARESVFEHEHVDMTQHIRVTIYTGSSIDTATTVELRVHETELIYHSIDRSKPLVLYIHGFREHPANESVRTIVGVHLERGNDNVMLLDWSDLAFDNYITVVGKTRDIGKTLAHTFDELVNLGLDRQTFHCIGHSLGAQIAGFFGKYTNNSVARITGLDPANPGFYYPGAKHINAGSATFVDIIHTDGGHYGTLKPTGTVDFFPNKGTRPQPGCSLLGLPLTSSDLCSHWRSWRYYAESVLNDVAFPASQCSSNGNYLSGKCTGNRLIYFGYATPTDAQGCFYFTTNEKSPFGQGPIRVRLQ